MTSLADLALPLRHRPPSLLVRVVAVDGVPALRPGATRAHRRDRDPLGEPFGAALDDALTDVVDDALQTPAPAALVDVHLPGIGSVVVLRQWTDELPDAAWDLLRGRCSFALHTRWQAGRVTTRAVVPVPAAIADARACHALDLLMAGTSQVALARDAGATRLVETFCAPRRLVTVGTGALDAALADVCPLTLWAYEHRDVHSPADLADLTATDLLVVMSTPRRQDVVALALDSPVGHVGLVAAGQGQTAEGPADRLHLLDPDDDCPPAEQALVVLSELMAVRREQARRWWGSMVLAG